MSPYSTYCLQLQIYQQCACSACSSTFLPEVSCSHKVLHAYQVNVQASIMIEESQHANIAPFAHNKKDLSDLSEVLQLLSHRPFDDINITLKWITPVSYERSYWEDTNICACHNPAHGHVISHMNIFHQHCPHVHNSSALSWMGFVSTALLDKRCDRLLPDSSASLCLWPTNR